MGFQNKLTGLANNTLIKNNYIKNLYKPFDTEIHWYENEARGILVYGNKVNIEENYLENILGGGDTDGIYTKAFSSRITNNTLYSQ